MTSKSDPAKDWFDVTPSDVTVYGPGLRSLWINGAGDVTVESLLGNTATFTVEGSTILPCDGIRRVLATGTTATGLVGLL